MVKTRPHNRLAAMDSHSTDRMCLGARCGNGCDGQTDSARCGQLVGHFQSAAEAVSADS